LFFFLFVGVCQCDDSNRLRYCHQIFMGARCGLKLGRVLKWLYSDALWCAGMIYRVTTCLEMSGNLTAAVREVSGLLLWVGSVRAFTMSQENFREKILSGKSCLKLFIVGLSCILASIQVFSRSLCCVKYYIYGWIMYRFIPTSPLIVTLVRAWYECWVPQTVREVHIVWSGEWSAWL